MFIGDFTSDNSGSDVDGAYAKLFTSPDNTNEALLLPHPFYRLGNWGTGRVEVTCPRSQD